MFDFLLSITFFRAINVIEITYINNNPQPSLNSKVHVHEINSLKDVYPKPFINGQNLKNMYIKKNYSTSNNLDRHFACQGTSLK